MQIELLLIADGAPQDTPHVDLDDFLLVLLGLSPRLHVNWDFACDDLHRGIVAEVKGISQCPLSQRWLSAHIGK